MIYASTCLKIVTKDSVVAKAGFSVATTLTMLTEPTRFAGFSNHTRAKNWLCTC